jgi:hypothetical protein
MVKVTDDTILYTTFEARKEGELKCMNTTAIGGEKVRADWCEVAVFARHVLQENNGQPTTDADFEAVTYLASKDEGSQPIDFKTMAVNFLELPGGTFSPYTAKDFAESIIYHLTHVKLDPSFESHRDDDSEASLALDALNEMAESADYEARTY